jgi:haloalkane dehalogenase
MARGEQRAKTLFSANPASLLIGRRREFCRTLPNQREVGVKGIHFIREDSPQEIGEALRGFIDCL